MRNVGCLMMVLLGAAGAACSSVAGGPDGVDSRYAQPPSSTLVPARSGAGDFVSPTGFTSAQTSQVALAPGVFVQEGAAIVTATTLLRRSLRAQAGLPVDAPSNDLVDDFRLEATLAADYAGGMRVNTSARPLAYVELVPQGGSRAPARVRNDGAIVAFDGAFPNVTSAIGAHTKRVEEFLLIPTPADVPPLRYDLNVGPDFGWWDQENGQLYAFASDGRALFAIAPPVAIDATGARLVGAWDFTPDATGAGVLAARLDMSALTFPVMFDPNFVQPAWYPETKAAGTIPSGFAGAAGFYDSNDGCVGLYGGGDGNFALNSTVYLRCNGAWSAPALNGTTTPPPRVDSAATWATGIAGQSNGLYVFGGYGGTAPNITTLADFWVGTYAAAKWTWKQIALPPTGGPAGRFMPGLSAIGGSLYLFGGTDKAGNLLTDTWKWNGSTWTQLCATCFPEGGSAGTGRYGFASTVVGGKTYVIGGWATAGYSTNVYTFNGTTWSPLSTLDALVPTDINGIPVAAGAGDVHPTGRVDAWASASGASAKNIVFGSGLQSTGYNPTFFYDAWSLFMDSSLVPVSPTPQWSRIPAPNPGAVGADPIPGDRALASAIYDTKLAEVVLIGGQSAKATSSVRIDARRYKEEPQLITLTVTCQDNDRDGRCNSAADNYLLSVYYDLDPVAGQPTPISQLYFVQKNAAGLWSTAIGSGGTNCGTAATPLQGSGLTGTLTCTVPVGSQTSFGVFDRDAVFGPSTSCAGKDAGAICDVSPVYPGVSTCSAALPTTNRAAITCN